MKNKQTAVEWFIEQLEQKGDMRETPSIRNLQLNINTSDYLDLKRQAKAMERQQIKEAYMNGWMTREYKPIKTEASHSQYADGYLRDIYGL